MTQYTYANNISTALAGNINSSQTSLTVLSTANFPTITGGEVMALTLNDQATGNFFEVVYVTAQTGSTLTVLRGQEGTAPRAWLANDFAYAATTAGILGNFAPANSTNTFTSGSLTAIASSISQVGATISGFSNSQTADLLDVTITPGGALAFSISYAGAAVFNSSNSADLPNLPAIIGSGAASGALVFNANSGAGTAFFFTSGAAAANTLLTISQAGNIAQASNTTLTLPGTNPIVNIGTSSGGVGSGQLKLGAASGVSTLQTTSASPSGTAVAGSGIGLFAGATIVMTVSTAGAMGIAGTLSQSSARSTKKAIRPLSRSALDLVKQTNWVEFLYKSEADNARRHVGFVSDDTDEFLSGKNRDEGYEIGTIAALACAAIKELLVREEARVSGSMH